MVKKYAIAFLLCFISLVVFGQEDDWAEFAEEYIEELTTEEDGTTGLYEELMEMHRHPLDINRAQKADLMRMPFLTEEQADSILSLVSKSHGLLSMGELMFVKNLYHKERKYLALFFFCSSENGPYRKKHAPDSLKNRPRNSVFAEESKGLRTDLSVTMGVPLYKREGFKSHTQEELQRNPNCQYLGNNVSTTLRYRSSLNNRILWGLTAQKDEGEPFAAHGNGLYDSYSAFVMGKGEGPVKKWIVGDFTAHFGLGLTIGSSGADPMSVLATTRPRQAGFTAHTATDEALFLRGGAIDIIFGKINVKAFGSWRKLDATLKGDSISTIITDGYHRTPLEMNKRHNISALQGGVSVGADLGILQLGVNAALTHYDTPYCRPTSLYRKYYFQGNNFGNYSLTYSTQQGALKFWGETAISQQGGLAALHRLQFAPHHKIIVNLLHRYYSKHYLATSAQSYRTGSRIQNEHGVMLGISLEPIRQWVVKSYLDVAHFPFAVYASQNPKNTVSAMLQMEYTPYNTTTWLLRYMLRSRPDDNNVGQPDSRVQHTLKAQWRYSGKVWKLTSTADFTLLSQPDKEKTSGWMLSQKASVAVTKATRLSMAGAVFHTDSYAEALRLYEPILLYSGGYPACYYHGGRLSASVQHTIGPLSMAVKYALTHYTNRDSIGSGLRQYNGSTLQDILIQVALRF